MQISTHLTFLAALFLLPLRLVYSNVVVSRDWGQVQISTHDDQAGWSEWAGVGNLVRDYSNAWSMMAVDLTAYAGMRVRVAFYHSSDEGDVSSGWYVDDVRVVKKTPEFDGTFEGGWGGWYADRGVWQIGEGAGPEGEGRYAGTVFDGSYPDFTDSRLVSPTFALPSDLGAGEEIHLRFWQRFSYYPYDLSYSRDWGQVQISTHDDQTGWSGWEDVGNCVQDYGNVWSLMAVDLTAYAGMRVRVAFYHSSDEGDVSSGWYVDDVSVVKKTPEFDGTFDGGWGDWHADRGVWQIGEGAGPDGDGRYAGTVFDGSYADFTDSRLVSPTFELPSELGAWEELHLRFWQRFSYYPYDWSYSRDWGQVQISTHDDQTGWSDWVNVGNRIQDYGNAWSMMAVDLTAYAGMRVRVAFFHSSDEGDVSSGWRIDDVSVVRRTPEFDGTFEGGWGDWHSDRGVWQVGIPTSGPNNAYEGSFAAGTVLGGNYSEFTDSRLVGPTMELPPVSGEEEIHLHFYHWYSYASGDWGQVQVQAWDEEQGVWSDWKPEPEDGLIENSNGEWTPYDVGLTDYAGRRIRFALYHTSDSNYRSSGWYVDFVQIIVTTDDLTPPENVTDLGVDSYDEKVLLHWTHSVNSEGDLGGYKVYFDDPPSITVLGPTENSHDVTGLAPASVYTARVTAFDIHGNENNGVTIQAATLLPNPQILSAEPFGDRVALSWSQVQPVELVREYAIYAAESDFNNVDGMTPLASVSGTQASGEIAGLESATTYYFAVTAVNLSGNDRKEVATVSATIAEDILAPETTITGGPANGSCVASTDVALDWSGSDNSSEALVYSYKMDEAEWSSYDPATSIAFDELSEGSHIFSVKAKDETGNEDPSPAVRSFRIDSTAPEISDIQADPSITSATVSWTTSEPGSSQVEYGADQGYGSETPFIPPLGISRAVTIAGLSPNATYHYRIKSGDDCGNETVSADMTFATSPDLVPPDTFFTSGPSDNEKVCDANVNLCWQGTDDVTGSSDIMYSYSLDSGIWSDWSVESCHVFDGLAEGLHTVLASAKDGSGNEDATPAALIFYVDTTAPGFTSIASAPRDYTAAIYWNASEPAASQVEYGETEAYGMSSPVEPTAAGANMIAIDGLAPETTYHCRIMSNDGCREAESEDMTFATTSILYPNLRIIRLDMPETVRDFAQIDIGWLERNDGPGAAQGSWTDRVFLSSDEILDPQDTLIAEFVFSDGLEWETERLRDLAVDMPPMPPGTYYIILQTDADGVIDETSEDDNTFVKRIDYLTVKEFAAAPDQVAISLHPGETIDGEINLVNLGQAPLTGVTAIFEGTVPEISIEFEPPSTLDGNTVLTVGYSVTASSDSVAYNSPVLALSTAEGQTARVTFNIAVSPGSPKLSANPGWLEATMVRGNQTFVQFEVTNTGAASANNLKIVLPSTEWLSLIAPDRIDSLGPGEKISVDLGLNPSEDLPLGPYTGTLVLSADNANEAVDFRFTAVSNETGGLKIVAKDEFSYFADDHPPVSGAAVKIGNPYDGTVVSEGFTDADGQFIQENLFEGIYNIEVSAENHGTYNAVVRIYPEQTKEITAFLPRQLVTYTWKVEPVQTEDRYTVTLETVFETHVPAPVITVEPMVLDLRVISFDENGNAVVNYTITNHGLIAAQGATIRFGTHPDYEVTPINGNIGEIPAMTTLEVPVTVKNLNLQSMSGLKKYASLLFSFLSATAYADDQGDEICGFPGSVAYSYVCGVLQGRSVPLSIVTGECSSSATPGIFAGAAGPSFGGSGGGAGGGVGATIVASSTPLVSGPSMQESVPCEPGVPPDDGCGGCGTCLKCVDGACVPEETCEGDGTCEPPCEDECVVCREGVCVPDLRCTFDDDPCESCPTHLDCVTCNENGICIFDGCGGGDGDGTCVPPCGAGTRCSNGRCIPNDSGGDDGSCPGGCGHCSICRDGECVPDARCDLNPGDGEDESDTRDKGSGDPTDIPTVPDSPTVDTGSASGGSTTADTADKYNEHSTSENNDQRLDPILMFSGELLIETTDLKIPGRGFDFEFKRTYRSRYESNGVLGHGWEHNHEERLVFPANTSEYVLRFNGFSRYDVYQNLGGGRFKSPDGLFNELRRNDDGTYTLRNFDGVTTHYSAGGITSPARMIAREDRYGNRMQYIYEDTPLGLQGPLVRVIDTLGRAIEFGYNDQGRLITVKDFTGRTVRFTYDRRGDLIRARTPVVTGTSTNNDFLAGKTTCYEYYHDPFWIFDSRLKRLEHNLLAVWDPKGQDYLRVEYETSTRSYAYDRVIEQQHGTPDQINRLTYTQLNEDVPGLPYDPDLPRNETVIIDRNGNRKVLVHNGRGQLLEERVETNRNVNTGDPDAFVTKHTYNADGNRLSTTFPEGNRIAYVFDTANSDRLQQGNLLSVTREPGPRAGDQTSIKTTYNYEPIYNQVRSAVEARGNDATFVPQNGGTASAQRYTTSHTFDYQEGSSYSIIPGLAAAIHRDEAEVADALSAAGISLGLGDVNGDGRTDQIVGNVVRKVQPTVNLLANSRQAGIEGDTTQEIVSEFIYNRFGQITAEIDPDGNVDEYFYYPERDPDGDGYNTSGVGLANDTGGYKREVIRDSRVSPRRRSTEPPTQISNQWKYDRVGNVTETTDGRGNTTRFIVNALNQVERRISEGPFNFEHAYIYDANDNVVREEVQNVDTNGPGLDASVTYTYQYDILDNRIVKTEEVSTGEVLTTRYEYDSNENQTRIVLPEGNVMERVYDERDLVFTLARGAGSPYASTQTITYDGNGNLVKTVDAEDNNGDGIGEATLVAYDGYDRKIRAIDAVGNVMTYRYDPAGNVVRERSFGVDGGPSPTSNSGAGNVLLKDVEYRYDELSRRFETNGALFANTRPVGPDGPLTPNDGRVTSRREYDRNGRLARTLDDNAHERVTEYDGADRVVLEIDELGNETRKTYDGNNNVIAVVELERSPDGLVPDETFTTGFEYDTLDRRTAVIDNLGNRTEYRYDSRNNLVGTTDALGNTATHTYDGINRKLSDVVDLRVGGIGAGAIDTSNAANADGKIGRFYDWDGNSRLVSETDDKGNVTTYVYDPLDRRIQEIYADTTVKEHTFDRDDNEILYVDQNGSVCTNTYDGLHRLVRRDVTRATGVEGTTEQRFEYDGLSRRTRAFDNNDPADGADDSDVYFHYDSLHRLIAEVQNGLEVVSRFDGVGNRLRLTYPNGRKIEMAYDALDRLASIRNQGSAASIAAYKYIGPARALERTYANGTRLLLHDGSGGDVGYDGIKRTVQMRHADASDTLFSGYDYAYDKQHNRRYELDRFLGLADVYEYDSAYRLTRTQTQVPAASIADIANNDTTNADVEGLTGTEDIGYTLDGVGNWDSRMIDGSTTAYAVNAMNEYDAIGGAAQVHDDNGNLTDDGNRRFVYDIHNRLLRVTDTDSNEIARYFYDASNRRIRKDSNGDTTLYLYNQTQAVEERDGSGNTTMQFVYGTDVDEVLELAAGGQTYFYHENSLGSIAALTDGTGNVVERYRYGAYGEATILAPDGVTELGDSQVDNPYRFTGRRYDAETGIYYYRARFYDPERGRFLQRDPKGYEDGMGLYEYVGSNPVNFVDPQGTAAKNGSAGTKAHGASFRISSVPITTEKDSEPADYETTTPSKPSPWEWVKPWLETRGLHEDAFLNTSAYALKKIAMENAQRAAYLMLQQTKYFAKFVFTKPGSFSGVQGPWGRFVSRGVVSSAARGFQLSAQGVRGACGIASGASLLAAASDVLLGLSLAYYAVKTVGLSAEVLSTQMELSNVNFQLRRLEQRRVAPLIDSSAGGTCNSRAKACLIP